MEFNDARPPSYAADVAGYTCGLWKKTRTASSPSLDGLAREGVIDSTVSAHSGRIVKLTGDGFLIEFPTVQLDVACAIDLQEKMADSPLKFRMVRQSRRYDRRRARHPRAKASISRPAWKRSPTKAEFALAASSTNPFATASKSVFEDLGEKAVKHVSAPVRVYRIGVGDGVEEKVSPLAESMTSVLERPAVAVLPFDNMSGDADQHYLGDGLTEDLITELIDVWLVSGHRPQLQLRLQGQVHRHQGSR